MSLENAVNRVLSHAGEITTVRPGDDQLFTDQIDRVNTLLEINDFMQILTELAWVVNLFDQANTNNPNGGTSLLEAINELRALLNEIGDPDAQPILSYSQANSKWVMSDFDQNFKVVKHCNIVGQK